MWSPNFRDTWLNMIDSPQSFHYIDDCYVDAKSGLIYKDNDIFWEAANECLVWIGPKGTADWVVSDPRWQDRIHRLKIFADRMESLREYFRRKLNNSSVVSIDKECCLHLLHPFGRYVPGHIFDTMQKLHILKINNLKIDSCLLSSSDEIIDFDFHKTVLGLSAFYDVKNHGDIYKVKRLLFINPVGHPTSFTKDSFLFLRDSYFKALNISSEIYPSRKIFLTRRSGVFKRNILNELEIEEHLFALGVTVVDGSETFIELANLFASASHIAGIHGSLFMNSIFGNRHAKYVEYCPHNRVVKTFADAYKFCDSYDFTIIKADENHNMTLSKKDLSDFYSN